MTNGPGTLLVASGDLPSLVSGYLESDPTQLVLWHRRLQGAAGERRLALVEELAAVLGATRVVVADGLPESIATRSMLATVTDLLEACTTAGELGCHRVIWPIVCGPDSATLANAVERSCIVSSLAARVDEARAVSGPVLVEFPVADLADQAIADLAEDLGVPDRLFWPCTDEAAARGDLPCGQCVECRRWRLAYAHARVEWPWAGRSFAASAG